MPERARRRLNRAETPKWHLRAVYWAMFFSVFMLTVACSLVIVRVLFMFNIFNAPGPVVLLVVYAVVTLLVGAAFVQVLVHSVTRPILEMDRAARRIAQGDFDVELTENTFAVEIDEMADAFTSMAQELAATEMLRSDFVSNVSHEIKTPLASIVGYASLLQRPELTDERRLFYAEKIQVSARRLSNLTDDVLLLSRLESQDAEPDFEVFCLSEQLRESILLFDGRWAADDRVLEVDLEELDCRGNEELLAHVWQNLIGNALKFTGPGDVIRVGLRWVPDGPAAGEDSSARNEEPPEDSDVSTRGATGRRLVRLRRPSARVEPAPAASGHIEVEVSDTGIGMDEEECRRVFEKFYQADRSHATEGNGLGLTLCKRIVDLHGGAIAAASAPGEGTTITVTLPAPTV